MPVAYINAFVCCPESSSSRRYAGQYTLLHQIRTQPSYTIQAQPSGTHLAWEPSRLGMMEPRETLSKQSYVRTPLQWRWAETKGGPQLFKPQHTEPGVDESLLPAALLLVEVLLG